VSLRLLYLIFVRLCGWLALLPRSGSPTSIHRSYGVTAFSAPTGCGAARPQRSAEDPQVISRILFPGGTPSHNEDAYINMGARDGSPA
jgi:hypothetical protein